MSKYVVLAGAAFAAFFASPVVAQESKGAIEDSKPRWTLSAEPAVWFAAPGGKIKIGAAGEETGRVTRTELLALNLDSPKLTPGAEVNLRRGKWGVSGRGFFFAGDGEATQTYDGQVGRVVYGPGDRLRSELEFGMFELEGSYRFVDRKLSPRDDGGFDYKWTLDGIAGARYYDVSWSVRDLGSDAADSADETFLEPVIGGKLSMHVVEQVTVDLQVSAGGIGLDDYSVWSVDVIVGVQWNPHQNLGVQAGYRQLAFGLGAGDGEDRFEQRGALAGVYAGVVLRF